MQKVGSILESARLQKGLTIFQVSEATKIQPRFIEALEKGDFSVFASSVYIKRFLKNYAAFLSLDPEKVLAFWRRDYQELPQDGVKVNKFIDPLLVPKFAITPGAVFAVLIGFLTIAFFGYILHQYRSFSRNPNLEVSSPVDGAIVASYRLNAVGKTDSGAEIFLNGEEVSVSEQGIFAVTLDLAKGINVLNFKAKNKLGKETSFSRTVIVLPEEKKPEPVVAGEATRSASPSATKKSTE